jgi:hypothetical protein
MFSRPLHRHSLTSFAGIIIAALVTNTAISESAYAESHIQIERDVLLESGVPIWPSAIISTADGGFVIVGTITESQAWAIRIDSNMKVMWRHTLEHPDPTPGIGESAYRGAVMLPDNSTLLCGYKNTAPATHPVNLGVLTHIGPNGGVLSRHELTPMDDSLFKLGYLRGCAASTDGISAFGSATRVEGVGTPNPVMTHYQWFLEVDPAGGLKSQKVTPAEDQGLVVPQFTMTANGDMAVSVFGGNVLFDHDGTVKQRRLGFPNFLLQSLTPQQMIRTISEDSKATVTMLDSNFREVATIQGVPMGMRATRAYSTPAGIAVFGLRADQNGATTAAIGWLRSDLCAAEVFTFRPISSSPLVQGATPTRVPGQFAFVRPITPRKQLFGPDETRNGLLLTFVRYR